MNAKAMELIAEAQAALSGAYAGGVSASDKAAKSANTDRTTGSFRRGQFDNPNAG